MTSMQPWLRPTKMRCKSIGLLLMRGSSCRGACRSLLESPAKSPSRHRLQARCADMASRLSLRPRSEEHTSELQSLMRISYAVFCLTTTNHHTRKAQPSTPLPAATLDTSPDKLHIMIEYVTPTHNTTRYVRHSIL